MKALYSDDYQKIFLPNYSKSILFSHPAFLICLEHITNSLTSKQFENYSSHSTGCFSTPQDIFHILELSENFLYLKKFITSLKEITLVFLEFIKKFLKKNSKHILLLHTTFLISLEQHYKFPNTKTIIKYF